MMRRLRPRGDSGAYAILYALLLLTVLGMAALVVDLAALRQNRRSTRSASDAAAVAGARELDVLSGSANPREACEQAWSYLATNLGFTVPGSTGCDGFPTTVSPCPLTWPPAVGSVDDFTVKITWPVADDSTLLTQPNVTGGATQAINPDVDGDDPCARLAVSVQEDQDASFSTVFGSTGTSTAVTSVARAATRPGPSGAIAALNVLDRTKCQVIDASGQGSIIVGTVTDAEGVVHPGIISVESSGTAGGSSCSGSKVVIDAGTAATEGVVRADGPDGAGKGKILSYALNSSPTGNPGKAYSTTATTSGKLAPTPSLLGTRTGATPVTNVYGCDSGCDAPHITNLRAAYGGTSIPTAGYAGSPSPYDTQAFTVFKPASCSVKGTDVFIMPAHNYYIDCPSGLDVKGILVFQGGNVVSRGSITLTSVGACLAINVPVTGLACPNILDGNVATPPTTEAIFYLQGNSSISRTNGSFYAANTFTYMNGGTFGLGGGEGTILMTNPRLDTVPAGCDEDCQDARFWKGTLWNESGNAGNVTQSIGGQGSLFLRGVLFTPNSLFVYAGQAVQEQVGAQFWTDMIRNSGQGALVMTPNPSDVFESPLLNVVLIR